MIFEGSTVFALGFRLEKLPKLRFSSEANAIPQSKPPPTIAAQPLINIVDLGYDKSSMDFLLRVRGILRDKVKITERSDV
jgi:hypothetical protein